MSKITNANEVVEEIRTLRQARLFENTPVTDDHLATLLDVARWTGSARNTQPWHFIVIRDKETLRRLSQLRTPINWLADAPIGIAIVLDGHDESMEAYDEGRVTERLLVSAKLLGYGGGIAWFGDAPEEAEAKSILGVPAEKTARSVVALGVPTTTKDHRPNANIPGRKAVSEVVSIERFS